MKFIAKEKENKIGKWVRKPQGPRAKKASKNRQTAKKETTRD